MKTIVAFAGGAVLAAGIAVLVMKKEPPVTEPQVAQAVVTPVPSAAPVPPEMPAAVQETPAPRAVAPEVQPRPVKTTTKSIQPKKGFVPPQLIQETPSQPAASSAPRPASQPAVVTPTPAVEPPAPAAVEPPKPTPPPEPNRVTIAAGTNISIRLIDSLSSDAVQPGQAFHGTIDQALVIDGFVIAERGARVEGRITDSQQAGRVKGVSHLALELTRFTTSDGQRIPIATQTWEKEGEQSRKSDATKVAAGAGIGAALGAIFGGGKGAAVGAASGGAAGGGVVLATRGKPVTLPSETRLTFRLRSPVTITEKR